VPRGARELSAPAPGAFWCEGEWLSTLPDLIGAAPRVLFVGYNPGLRSARLGHYYAGRNNRFWELLAASGLTPRRLRPDEDGLLPGFGIAITDLVKRPTRAAHEVGRDEFRAGVARVQALVAGLRPAVVAWNGKGVYLLAARATAAPWGAQARSLFDGVTDFVLPSPSGLARIPFAEKSRWYGELAGLCGGEPRTRA
jgi:TDG/mug DNA glycosylase family protein